VREWAIVATQDEESYFDEHIRTLLTSEAPPLPPRRQHIGHVEVRWNQVAPGSAFIQAVDGTHADRLLARTVVAEQLRPHGLREASWEIDGEQMRRTATWEDIEAKAKRLIQSGNVQVLRNGYTNIVGVVKGDHGTYQPEIFRQDPNSRAITQSDCQCDWGQFQNLPRTRKWKRFQDRSCAHILALWWAARSMPLDEDVHPAAPGGEPGSQTSLFNQPPTAPGAGVAPGQFRMGPGAPSGLVGPDQMAIPGMGGGGPEDAAGGLTGPSPADVLPQFQNPGETATSPASIPGLKGPTPTSPVANPTGPGGAFSSWRFARMEHVADDAFTGALPLNNGDLVQLRYDDKGTLVGRSEEHGAGQDTAIGAGQVGEVLGTDPTTGMVNVLYMGSPWDKNGPMEPYGATAWHFPSYVVPRPDLKRPGPALRRSR
jgi:hypothetical protein